MYNENEEVLKGISEREHLENIIADATERLEKLSEREHLENTIEEASIKLQELTEQGEQDINGGAVKYVNLWKTVKVKVGTRLYISKFIQPQGRSFPWDLKVKNSVDLAFYGKGKNMYLIPTPYVYHSKAGCSLTWSVVKGTKRTYYCLNLNVQVIW